MRSKLKRLALPLAGLLLFAQVALAAQACMLRPQGGSVQESVDAMAADDCIGIPADTTSRRVNCLRADELANPSADYHFLAILPPATALARFSAPQALHFPAIHSRILQHGSSPPLQILYCSFQI